jgi:hypothetical protein
MLAKDVKPLSTLVKAAMAECEANGRKRGRNLHLTVTVLVGRLI